MNQAVGEPGQSSRPEISKPHHSFAFSRRSELGQGQPIGRLMAQAIRYPNLISLAAGFVDNATLPCEATQRCLDNLSRDTSRLRRALQYDTAAGNAHLRSTIAAHSYAAWPGSAPDPERIILTAGSNQFLHVLAEALIDPGDIVIAAAPTYFVFMGTLKGVEARVVGVRADEDGLCIDSVEEQLQQLARAGQSHRVKAIYCVTEFDNPAGSTLSMKRREQLLSVVARWRAEHGPLLIISDNAYQLLRYEGEMLPPMTAISAEAAKYVIELGTFSKSFSPGVRVGWGVLPDGMAERLLDMKSNIDFGSPHFSQMLLHEVITSGEFDRHLPVIREGYSQKLHAMLAAMDEHLAGIEGVQWRRPQGGLYVWLTLPEHLSASEDGPLWSAATESGVLYVPGQYCYPSEGVPVGRNTIRLSFGVQTCEGIADGIQRLAAAIRSVA